MKLTKKYSLIIKKKLSENTVVIVKEVEFDTLKEINSIITYYLKNEDK